MDKLCINPDTLIGDSSVSLSNLSTKADGDGYARAKLNSKWAPDKNNYGRIPWNKSEGTSNITISNGYIGFGSNVGWASISLSTLNDNWENTGPYYMLVANGSVVARNHPGVGCTNQFNVIFPVNPSLSYWIECYNMSQDGTASVQITNDEVYTYLTIKTFGK